MLEQAKEILSALKGQEVLAAVSGGMDSMCLLHLLHTWGAEQNIAVTAAHFNHCLRGIESDEDEAFVRGWCEARGVPFVCGRGNVAQYAAEKGLSIETAAREMRYAFLRDAAKERLILTAHHADDNAETMLLNLLRGTGLRGLTGIPASPPGIRRPLLEIPQAELAAYAAAKEIRYVEDSSNRTDDAARNVLRHRVLPVLKELNPRAVENMTRTAALLVCDEEALSRAAETLLEGCRPIERGLSIPAESLQTERAVQSRCVLEMLARVAGRRQDLSAAHVEAVCGLLCGPQGRELSLPYGVTARYDDRELLVFRGEDLPGAIALETDEDVVFGRWRVRASETAGEIQLSVPHDAVLTVTLWSREDGLCLPGSRGCRSLKRLCADAGIPPDRRDRLPVLRVNGRCAAVPGIGIDWEFAPELHGKTVFITFFNHKETEENHHDE